MKTSVFLCVFVFVECIEGLDPILEEDPRRSFPARRAIDGSRGRKYYEPVEEDTFDIYGSGGRYDPYGDVSDFSDIRRNVPGEPGVDYPSYMTIPQTSFQCQGEFRGYYADEEAGCQLFHVCDGSFLVSSFLCPIGSIFSQKLLTCDWWNKVDCTSTRNYHTVNRDRVTQADDDEILRKAYEMTSLQSSHNGISVDTKPRNSVRGTAQIINDLQTGPSRYDYPDDISEFKYSSKYRALNHHDRDIDYYPTLADGNQQNPKIKVHTIGQDQKNDADPGEFRPSYAPTVPTVTTTTRRFYSPTVPTTTARPKHRYDLEFESSDHLYSARGKTQGPSTASPVTKPTIDTTTSVVVEVPPTLGDSLEPRIDQVTSSQERDTAENTEVITEKSQVVAEYSAIEFQSLYSGENYTYEIDDNGKTIPVKFNVSFEIPATEIIPPFFYYSSVDQHEVVSREKLQDAETNSTASTNQLIINVPATDVVPPLFYSNETNTEDNRVPAIEIEPPLTAESNLSVNNSNDTESADNEIPPPSRLFLPPLCDLEIENSTNLIQGDERGAPNATEKHRDASEGESSPYQVTLTVKGDEEFNPRGELIRSLIAQHETAGAIRDIEIVQSQQTTAEPLDDPKSTDSGSANDRSRAQVINYAVLNRLRGDDAATSLAALRNADQFPRPFSREPPRRVEVTTPSSVGFSAARSADRLESSKSSTPKNNLEDESKKKEEILQQLAQTFGRPVYKSDGPVKFDLPQVTRAVDFKSGRQLETAEKESADEEGSTEGSTASSAETEFLPSIGFSLNTAAEREEYVEAVLRGLFTDVSVPTVNKSTDKES